MLNINTNENLEKYIKDKDIKDLIEKVIKEVLKLEKIDKNIYVSIFSCTKKEIKDLNNKYRNIDKVTDVLSFPVFEKNEIKNININEIELGDIFLCLEVIEENSIKFETGIKRELIYMILHGILHLLGYDHIEENDKKIMRTKEKEILNNLGVFK